MHFENVVSIIEVLQRVNIRSRYLRQKLVIQTSEHVDQIFQTLSIPERLLN